LVHINSVERLEQCLAIQLAPEVRDHIAQMALPLTARIDRMAVGPLVGTESSDAVFWIIPRRANRRLFYEDLVDHPRVETRTPLKSEWEERLKQTKETPKDSDANPDVNPNGPTCCICMDSEPTIMLAPCMHQCVCDVCVKELMERDLQSKKCPICRADIVDIYKPIK
jgi:Zinc finger, C3HC4 type (RING finger)